MDNHAFWCILDKNWYLAKESIALVPANNPFIHWCPKWGVRVGGSEVNPWCMCNCACEVALVAPAMTSIIASIIRWHRASTEDPAYIRNPASIRSFMVSLYKMNRLLSAVDLFIVMFCSCFMLREWHEWNGCRMTEQLSEICKSPCLQQTVNNSQSMIASADSARYVML